MVKPLEGVKVVTYYGCLLSRPAQVAKFDDPNNPVSLDKIMQALGAEVLPFALKTECCGAAMGIPDVNIPGSLSGRILETAKAVGAEAVVTEEINNLLARGAVSVSGLTWSARSCQDTVIPVGTVVRVDRIEGVKLYVFENKEEVTC